MSKQHDKYALNFNIEHLIFAEEQMKDILLEFGLYPNLTGFESIVEATFIMLKYDYRLSIKEVYKIIAVNKATSENAVEKAIRHAIKHIYNMGRLKKFEEIFELKFVDEGNMITSNQFISLMYLLIKKRMREKWGSIFPSTFERVISFNGF
ncbi:MAG: sporulation initiation factor Spo0A C-terminal domain-containing protein [Firmicutes bacterium]|nr:sporulation initiation factor Spo0A C-terminal domain-containing protein [Bacillota bacterium]MCL2255915.1 sporulation initiation factor Spo0A C-terminal domain-containing protein [Bacillota bacterium]